MKDVILDCDGVLADFEGLFCRKFGWENRWFKSLEYRYPDSAYEIGLFSQASKTYEQLDVVDIGVKIARFCENAQFDIHVVSSRPEYTLQTTGTWLKRNKIPFHYLSVENGSKLSRIKGIGPMFVVDDLLEVCEQCAEVGIPSFLIDYPWNQKDSLDGIIYRITSFEDFLEILDKYFDV